MRKEFDFSQARRGPVRTQAPGKTRITIRLDDDVLAWFKAEVHAAGQDHLLPCLGGLDELGERRLGQGRWHRAPRDPAP